MNKNGTILKRVFLCILFAALTVVLAQIEISLPVVPISGQTLAVGLTATILGSRLATLSILLYVLIGALGAPVFTGLDGGLHVLAGPTGGYIFGFLLAAFVIGFILERSKFTVPMAMIANTVGMIVILMCGVIQLKYVLELSWQTAVNSGIYPFIITGLIKAFLAGWIGIIVRKRLIPEKVLLNKNG